jgi:DNA repair/transcription protein MET18/MMS19
LICLAPQTLFNITFCYFPITFKPPPNDPYGISAEDLRTALRLAAPLFRRTLPTFLSGVQNLPQCYTGIWSAGYPCFSRETDGRFACNQGSSKMCQAVVMLTMHFQRDALQTMCICLPVYGVAVAHGFARKLWSSLKLEVIIQSIVFLEIFLSSYLN